jgi:hypothetical protein
VLPRLARLLAFIAAVQILGGHWMMLQSVAWMGMVIDYSKQLSLPAAIGRTFDGAHPCGLCKTVTKGRSDEQQQSVAKLVVKLEATLNVCVAVQPPVHARFEHPPVSEHPAALAFPPPTPPPLAA